jgi:DNA-binding MarR family transcriptional regulator
LASKTLKTKKTANKSGGIVSGNSSREIFRHWQEAVPDDRLAHLVKDATRALVRALALRLSEHDIPFGHWSFLRILWESDGLTQRELSARAGVMEPTTYRALKAMEERGFVNKLRTPPNKKNIYIHLTPKGRALKKKLIPLAEEVNHIAVGKVKSADIGATRKALLAIIENLAADETNEG